MANQHDWKIEALPIHGYQITDANGAEIIRDIYEQKHAEQIVKEHNAVVFAVRDGQNWALGD